MSNAFTPIEAPKAVEAIKRSNALFKLDLDASGLDADVMRWFAAGHEIL